MNPTAIHRPEQPATSPATSPAVSSRARKRPRGQVLVLYVMAVFVFIGMLAIVLDISWYWINSNRVQKAADAAALAGVVWLPGDEPKAVQTAIYEAAKNGYTVASSGVAVNGLTLTAAKATGNDRRLNVSISAPVGTFFMRVFGLTSIQATRSARAEYVLPVAMGSPENYLGVFGPVRDATMTTTTIPPPTTVTSGNTGSGKRVATTTPAGANWAATSGTLITAVATQDTAYARTSTQNAVEQWGAFGLATAAGSSPIPNTSGGNPSVSVNITGIVVSLDDTFLSAACANSTVGAELSWNNGTTWSSQVKTAALATNTTTGDYTLGVAGNTTVWGGHSWTRNDFTDANFRIRLQELRGCGTATIQFNVDQIRIEVYYTTTTITTFAPVTTVTGPADYPLYGPGAACVNGVAGCAQSTLAGGGQVLNPRGFWATMNTEGAWNLNGDAFQPYYDNTGAVVAPTCPTATLRACYDPNNYYNYAVEMPPNSTGGYVYIFDPVFCETATASGTGDRHFSGDTSPVSSFYELYDTGSSLFSRADDTLIVSSGTMFTGMANADTTMGGTNGSDCRQRNGAYGDARDYHDSWYLLNPSNPLTGGPGGTIYRLHTTGTDPSNLAQQQATDGEQSFAIFATGTAAGGVLPKVYGLGAMQMFTPLEANSTTDSTSEFYLAQIDAIHAGKTLELHLWDPGDTKPLTADISVLIPSSTTGVWNVTPLSYTAAVGTSGSGPNSACNTNTGSSVTSIRTNNGNTVGNFNGCWLTIDIPIPTNYTAPQNGWWKIRYVMRNALSGPPQPGTSVDVTTWTAEIQGNPVHLVVP